MPIKNLDDSLFTDNEPKKAKPSKPEINFSADNTSEIYNELNKFMADMPDDMLDKFKDLSNSLSSKLEDVNLADLFNIEVNKVEIKNPYVTKLFQELTKYNEKELEDPVIVAKLIELTDFLNKYKTNKSEVVEEKINYIAKINELTDDILNIVVDKFNPEDFIKQYNFVLKDNNYVLEDLSNIKLVNPLDNSNFDLTNSKLVYGNVDNRTNSLLADRVLLYLNKADTTSYIILYAYNKDNNYQLFIPKFANAGLLRIDDKLEAHKVRQTFFKYKNVKACLEHIETIFVLKKEVNFPVLKVGSVLKNDPYYMGDNLVNVGMYTFNQDNKDFKQKFDVFENTLPFYIKVNNNLSTDKINYFTDKLKKYNFNDEILNNYELKYHNLKNYLYIEI